MQVVDVSNPVQPRLINTIDPRAGTVRDVAISGSRAYLARMSRIDVFDVSNPSQPRQIGSCQTKHGQQLAVLSNYLAAGDSTGVDVLDVSDPANPVLLGSSAGLNADAIAMDQGRLYVAADTAGLKLFQLPPLLPAQPPLPSLNLVAEGSWPGYRRISADRVAAQGDTIYALSPSEGLEVLDATNPTNLVHVAALPTLWISETLVVAGHYAFVSGSTENEAGGAPQIIDVSKPSQPKQVAELTTPGPAHRLAITGNYLYLTDEKRGCWLSISMTRLHPVQAGSFSTRGKAMAVAVLGALACVGNGQTYDPDTQTYSSGDLQVLDLSDPVNPRLLGKVDLADDPTGICAFGPLRLRGRPPRGAAGF
jgi:hypothetical protein